MKSRWITNLLLLMAIGALSLIAHFKPGVEKAQEQRLTALKQDAIQHITLTRPLLAPVNLVKKGNSWIIESDPPLPADPFQVNAITRLAEQKVSRSYPVTDLDLAQVKLATPDITVKLDDVVLEFGAVDPLEGLRYVRVGDRVHLIEDLYQNQLEADQSHFVRRRLFAEGQRITAITLPGFSMERIDGKWRVTPEQAVSSDSLQQFSERWQEASALSIQPVDGHAAGDSVTVTLAGHAEPVRFIIQSREPQLTLVRPDYGIQYSLGNRAADFLELPVDTGPDSVDNKDTD